MPPIHRGARIEIDRPRTHRSQPIRANFYKWPLNMVDRFHGIIGKQPYRAAKQVRIRQLCAATFLARHGMTGQKRRALRRIKQATCRV